MRYMPLGSLQLSKQCLCSGKRCFFSMESLGGVSASLAALGYGPHSAA